MPRSRPVIPIFAGFVILGIVAGALAVNSRLLAPARTSGAATSPATPSVSPPDQSGPSASFGAPIGSPIASPPGGSGVEQALGPGVTSCPSVSAAPGPAQTPPAHPVALAVPVLMYHRVVPPGEAGNSLPSLVVPPDVFERQIAALDAAGWRTITLSTLAADLGSGVTPPPKSLVVTFDDGYDDGFTYALPILQRHGFVGTFFIVPGRLGEPSILTDAHVRALAAAGMEIADHTMSHAYLPAMDDVALRFQIGVAADRIASITGRAPTTFAYPFGDRDARVIRQVAACGFAMAVTNVEGVRETWPTRFSVPRVRVGPGTTPDWLLYLVSHPAPPAPPPTPRPTPPPTPRPTPVPVTPTPGPSTPAPGSPSPSEGTPGPTPTPTESATPTPSPTPPGI